MQNQSATQDGSGNSHSRALKIFDQRFARLLALRGAVQWITLWFFVWGVAVLAIRFSGVHQTDWLVFGSLAIFPLILFAIFRAQKQKPDFTKIRASYDQLNFCGGVMMAEEIADMRAWQSQVSIASAPKLRWRSGRALLLLAVSALFVATALLLPERLTKFSNSRALEIGKIVQQLQAEVKTLTQEKILPDQKSNDLQKQLSQLQKDSSGFDPNKTWEALDHIKQADSDLAKQAADEALKKTESLTEAETLAKAMQSAAENGMDPATASQAAQDLASMLNDAKLEDGILNAQIPPELLASLNGLNQEQMQKLLQALELNKNALGLTVSNLANLKMIDPATLAKLANSSHTPDFAALANYLSQCKGGNCDALFSWLRHGKGGSRGGPGADITWNDGASEKDLKFQEHALPPSSKLDDAQLVGVSKAAPQWSANNISAQHGALDNAVASGGSAHAQIVLPEQRQAVQNFFKRTEN
jgi:hypothetical protein